MSVYIINTFNRLDILKEELCKYGNIGPIHIKRDSKGNESPMTFVLMDAQVASKVSESYFVKRYDFRKSLPKERGSLWISLPRGIRTVEEALSVLSEKMLPFVEYGLIGGDHYSFVIPLLSRETGHIRGYAFINFDDRVSIQTMAILRLFLNRSYWKVNDEYVGIASCNWSRINKK